MAAVVFYFVVSMAMVILNKFLMSDYQLPYPLTLTVHQFVVALVCIVIMAELGRV